MLSTENPPPDLPSPNCDEIKISRNVDSDERADGKLEAVDLLKPAGLDDNNPLPKFSIRDYVFYARGKDIKNNWPFSQKNLQLCLKYEVKNVLPPFQSLDSLRNPSSSTVKCADQFLSHSDVKLSKSTDHSSVGQEQLAVNIENNNNSITSKEDKEFPSTTTSQSCSDINSIPPISSSAQKQSKCKLIVKLNNIAQPKSNQDLGVSPSVLSETKMASKMCPVCKTFTSSSNTTLNAHIDQCLSGESTIKWTANSNVMKHRIKPRKKKLMVDIYETALHCTLEDLDKRNGTNWALSLGFPAQDLEAFSKEKKKVYPSVSIEDTNEKESDVYIDSNGTKLRILSKLADVASNSSANNDCGPNKLVKRDKGLLGKKKKFLGQKQKFPKHSLHGQGSLSHGPDHLLPPCGPKSSRPDHCAQSEVTNGESPEGYKEDLTQPLIACDDQMKSSDLGMIKKWVGSKRTGLKKKINPRHENRHLDKTTKTLRVKSADLSSVGDTLVKIKNVSYSPISSNKNPLSHIESPKRKKNLLSNSHDGCEQPFEGKRPRFSLLKPLNGHGNKNHVLLSKFNLKQSTQHSPSVHDLPNRSENHVSSRRSKKMEIRASSVIYKDSSFIGSRKSQHCTFSSESKERASLRKTSSHHAISTGSKKFKKLLSVRHASIPESKKNLERKHLNFKKSRQHYASGTDEEAVLSGSGIYRQKNLEENTSQMEKDSGKPLSSKSRILRLLKEKRRLVTSTGSNNHGGKNLDSITTGGNTPVDNTSDLLEEAQMQDEFVCEPTCKIADGEANLITFSKSLDSEFPDHARPSNAGGASIHYSLAYEDIVFCEDKTGKDNLVTHSSVHVVAEMDNIADDEAPRNYYADVDPIPIPGPPGSFLPSPGRIGSSEEELHGNSSLTTCRIPSSSEDEREMVDIGSSHSPISNHVDPHVQHEIIQCDVSDDMIEFDTPDNGVSTPFEHAASKERDLNNLQESGPPNLMLPKLSSREFKTIQQCCCSRKEGEYLHSGPLNHQDSQFLKRDLPSYDAQLDCVSPNLSTSSPVLRLMGKNLMVVNKADQNLPPQIRASQSNMMMEHYPGVKSCVYNSPSTSNIHNDTHSFHHILSQGPPVFDNMHHSMPAQQHFGTLSSSSAFQMPANFRPSELPVHQSKVVCSGNSFGGPNLFYDHQVGSKHVLNSQRTCDIEKVQTIPVSMRKVSDFCGRKNKEIIVINDSPEKESVLAIESTQCQLNTEAGFGAPLAVCGNYQTRDYSLSNESLMVRENGDNKMMPPSKGMNANLDKWNCTPQCSSVLHHPNSLSASLPSTITHLRSPLYFSPGFS